MKKFISLILIIVAMLSLVSCEETLGEIMLQVALSDKSDKTEIEGGYLHWKEVEGGYELASATIVVNKKTFTTFEIPSEFNGKPVVSIGNAVFSGWGDLETITIPDTVTRIGDGAFAWCGSLKSVVIPDTVTRIGDGAFAWCGSLESVVIPDSVTDMGEGAFSWCIHLESVILSENITVLKSRTFENCSSLRSIKLSSKLTTIEDNAFDGWAHLSLELPKTLTKIYYTAFGGSAYIYYEGTMEEWMQVERLIGEGNGEEKLTWSLFITCTDGKIYTSDTIDHMVMPDGFLE